MLPTEDDKKKTPRWLRWLGRQFVQAALRILDTDGDGKVEAHEVLALLVDIVEPELQGHPKVRS